MKPTAKSGRAPARGQALEFPDNKLLARLVGPHDRHLALIEVALDVRLNRRGNAVEVLGERGARDLAVQVMEDLYARLAAGGEVAAQDIDSAVRLARLGAGGKSLGLGLGAEIKTPRRVVTPRTPAQAAYAEALTGQDLVFGLGPAGTGKTYMAVAAAVAMLTRGLVDRVVLSRPAVEAGERLGFLPGDLKEKVDPYLRPLYDALFDMIPGEQVQRRMDAGDIEVAPLAFMRGRTLSHAFVILDEAQNATPAQMKMFLTRLGEGSRMVVTGDPSQTDLPKGQDSGLAEALTVLHGAEGIAFIRFTEADVVRHPMVTKIVRAYNAFEDRRRPGRGDEERGESR